MIEEQEQQLAWSLQIQSLAAYHWELGNSFSVGLLTMTIS
jgi:hypothetical protein